MEHDVHNLGGSNGQIIEMTKLELGRIRNGCGSKFSKRDVTGIRGRSLIGRGLNEASVGNSYTVAVVFKPRAVHNSLALQPDLLEHVP
ncbi:hypothetical protein MKW98_004012 [Papaver atlanticum]|uniref:Uncharacterized protein n=1 Tax=Papaver atlanticum TaxID=357466 RepID=A0AAD4XLP4_9MAGN|nr:hypothetical protein MKW98_004012 [Papaver atlanticum]